MSNYIVVTGGVLSGVGKGVTAASIGKILQEYGFSVTIIKIDPYINYDAGTLRPTEHGEVWVTDDGGEIDQDLGNYERFLDKTIPKINNITTGQIYKAIIDKERKGEFLGQTVQFIPHIPNEIKRRIALASMGYDFAIIEIGGTVGDFENIPFLFAVKSIELQNRQDKVVNVLVSYFPIPSHTNEMKTKPTQQAIRMLNQHGIFPDFVICRASVELDDIRKKKIETYANIPYENIISEPDIKTIYRIPLDLEKQGLGKKIISQFRLKPRKSPDWSKWKAMVNEIESPKSIIKIAIIGKYVSTGNFTLKDSYISVNEAISHAAAKNKTGINIEWIDSKDLEDSASLDKLKGYDGIIIPGGFGASGVEGKINAISFARKNNIPFLGPCYGFQLAVIEYARNVCNMKDANTTEINSKTPFPVIDVIESQKKVLKNREYGASMRLGAYAAKLKQNSRVFELYKETGRLEKDQEQIKIIKEDSRNAFRLGSFKSFEDVVLERHRHRYEVSPKYIHDLEKNGLVFSGFHLMKDNTELMEFLELPEHTFFVATQAHPEFKSTLMHPSPLFFGFIRAAKSIALRTKN